ncbi:hypothetical protein [Pseudobacter ginsenosidimutans]|uniref:Secreted protein (Por secretion system target) n=1 Tax=Pseudobacter ginsenosidimutans TaxID=661488 RepID=A0A4V2F082_9BACT|nr:hypothetical protein [Pseudobacter ginsenosidimutans]QEC40316.1 hypothetical protein FSB84_00895 [Pseudobacter ginsenosidimutans]RZS69080.1 hypothetical protein EV199_4905 [Pseudobacter ginsenosidimutans]
MRIILFVTVLLCGASWQIQAQCPFPSGTPDGACTGTPLTDGSNINTGQIFSYSGAATTLNNVNLSGGTIQVCGTLTIQNLNFNGGAIVVMTGGSLTLPGVNLNAGSAITNHGTITINGSLNVGGTDGAFINYGTANINGTFGLSSTTADLVNASPTAVFNAPGQVVNLSGEMVNLGTFNVGVIDVNGGADVCLGPNSVVNTNGIINNDLDGFIVRPVGSNACIYYTGNALLNNDLTDEANLLVCQATGATTSGAGTFGAAIVTPNCTGCAVVLPVVLESFNALISGQQIRVLWKSSSEDNVEGYGLEQSADGNNFSQVAFVQANNRPSSYQYTLPLQAAVYFRLRMQDRDGRYQHSKIIYVRSDDASQDKIRMLCSPCSGNQLPVRLITREAQQGKLIISNFSGQVLSQVTVKLEAGQQDIMVPVNGMAAGLYTLRFVGSRYNIGPVRWMKGR